MFGSMGEVLTGPGFRVCSRSGCKWPATSSLSFSYGTKQTWLEELRNPPEFSYYDLCHVHASRFSPPFGWTLEDRRNGTGRTLEPVPTQPTNRDDEPDEESSREEILMEPSLFDRLHQPAPQRLKPHQPSGPVASAAALIKSGRASPLE
jgi:uncharacterized protein DUF3499